MLYASGSFAQMIGDSVVRNDERGFSTLLAELDELTASSKSFFPGRVLLPRKKTYAVLDLINDRLLKESEARNVAANFDTYRRAVEAVGGVNALASGGNAGPSIWRIWFADVNRKRLSEAMQELHAALAPFLPSPPSSAL